TPPLASARDGPPLEPGDGGFRQLSRTTGRQRHRGGGCGRARMDGVPAPPPKGLRDGNGARPDGLGHGGPRHPLLRVEHDPRQRGLAPRAREARIRADRPDRRWRDHLRPSRLGRLTFGPSRPFYRREIGTVTFGEFLERHEREIFAYALRLTGSRADADDLYQETFLAAFRGWPPPRSGNERAWLYRIATNKAIDRARRSRHAGALAALRPAAPARHAAPPLDRGHGG